MFRFKVTFTNDESKETKACLVDALGICPAIEDAIRKMMLVGWTITKVELISQRKFVCNFEDEDGQPHREIFNDMEQGLEFVKSLAELPYEFYSYDELIQDAR